MYKWLLIFDDRPTVSEKRKLRSTEQPFLTNLGFMENSAIYTTTIQG